MDCVAIAHAQEMPRAEDVHVEDFPESSSEDEVEEAKSELEGLKADNIYFEFVENVSLNRDVKEDDPSDAEFVLQEELNKLGKTEEEAHLSSSSSSESDFEEALEEVEGVNAEVAQKIEIPPEMLKEASARFPPFWRMKYHLNRITDTDDKSEVDPDYVPPTEELDIQMDQPREVATDEMLSDNENDGDTSSVSSDSSDDEEVADNNLDGDNLIEMLEDLALPDEQAEAADSSSPVVEQVSLVQSIVEFDENGYKSEEDPDFVPAEDVANIGDVSSSDDSATEDDNDGEEEPHSDEGMEQ